jgi:hypothetical protein
MLGLLTQLALPFAIIFILLVAVDIGYRFGRRRMRSFPADQKLETGPPVTTAF